MRNPDLHPLEKGDDLYNVMADKVGFVPNIRAKNDPGTGAEELIGFLGRE